MTKSDVLKLLLEEYKHTVRLPDDISRQDYRDAVKREMGREVSFRSATNALNNLKGYTSLLVLDQGKQTRVWRKTGGKGKHE